MVTRKTVKQTLLGRDVAVAYMMIVALYMVRHVRFQPLQIPAYLLIVAYDLIEVAIPFVTPYHPLGFPLFLYLLAIVGVGTTHWVQSDGKERSAWFRIAGGVGLIIGSISLVFGAVVGGPLLSPTDNPTPLAITGVTGIIFLVGGWWLLGRPIIGGDRANQ